MSKIWPQGSSVGEVLRDDDELGLYKPSDAPAIADGSKNKKKTLLDLRTWLETAITNFSTGILTITGLFTVSGDGITSSTSTIDLKKTTTLVDLTGNIADRIEANTASIQANDSDISTNAGNISTLESKVGQSLNTNDNVTFNSVNGLIIETVEIGDWNMDASTFIQVNHGIADATKIRSASAVVRNDAGASINLSSPIADGTVSGGVRTINTTTIGLQRTFGGEFDSSFYSQTSYNRGWITIIYEA